VLVAALAFTGALAAASAQTVRYAFSPSAQYVKGASASAIATAYADWRTHVATRPSDVSDRQLVIEGKGKTVVVTIFATPGLVGRRTYAFQHHGSETIYTISEPSGSIVSRAFR